MGTYRSGDCPDDAWMGMIMEYAVMESCYGGTGYGLYELWERGSGISRGNA